MRTDGATGGMESARGAEEWAWRWRSGWDGGGVGGTAEEWVWRWRNGRGGGGMSVGGFTLGSVIIPGAATQASRGCEGAASAREGLAGEAPAGEVRTGERLARLRLVCPDEAVET